MAFSGLKSRLLNIPMVYIIYFLLLFHLFLDLIGPKVYIKYHKMNSPLDIS